MGIYIANGGQDLKLIPLIPLLARMLSFARMCSSHCYRFSRMAHDKSVIYLCLQEQCKDAHALLVKEAPKLFHVRDWSQNLVSMKDCKWGSFMDCKLFRFQKRSSKRNK